MYLDRLMDEGKALDWGICGVGVLPRRPAHEGGPGAQDCLYTLVVKHPDGTLEPRVIGSIVEYLFAPDDPEAVIEKMADEQTRIVSLTVTEGGYNFHAVTGEFDATNPDVVHDLEPGAAPRTTFGLITEALARRRERGLRAVHGAVVRQHPGQRRRRPTQLRRVRHAARPRARRRGWTRRSASPTAWSTGSPR